jgi:hypothetical protein
MQLQIVVDYHKKIQDIFMEMLDSMNDARSFESLACTRELYMHGDLF